MTHQISDQYPQWTQRITEQWEGICKHGLLPHPTIAALLYNASPVAVMGKAGEFVVFVQVEYAPHLEKLASPASCKLVEEVLQRMYDRVTIYVRFIGKNSGHDNLEAGTAPLTTLDSLPPSENLTALQEILNQWDYINHACKLKSPKAATLLSEATPRMIAGFGARELVLEVTSEEAYQSLSTSRYRGIGEWAVHAVAGIPYRIRLIHQGDPLPSQDVQLISNVQGQFLQPREPRPIQNAQVISDLQGLISGWADIQKACKRTAPKIAALLQSTEPVALIGGDKGLIVLRVEYDFHFEKLSELTALHIIEQAVNDVAGVPYRVFLIRRDDPIPTF